MGYKVYRVVMTILTGPMVLLLQLRTDTVCLNEKIFSKGKYSMAILIVSFPCNLGFKVILF